MSVLSNPSHSRAVRALSRVARFVAHGTCGLSFALAAIGAAHAQNIVPNPHLDTQLPPWTAYLSAAPDPAGAGSVAWVASPDSDNSPASGSASVVIDTSTPATNAASGMHQCIAFSTTTVSFVNYGMSVQIPAATSADGSVNATIEVRLFSDASCTNFIAGGTQGRTIVAGVPSDTTWYTVGDTNLVVSPAQAAQSAEVRAYLRETSTAPSAQSYSAFFDKFHLVLNSTTPVRLQEFGVE